MAARRLSCVRRGGSDRSRASTHLGCLARAVHARLERPSDILDVLRQGAMPVSLTRRVQRSWKAEGYRRRRTSTYVRAHVTHARPPGNPLARPAGTTVRARAAWAALRTPAHAPFRRFCGLARSGCAGLVQTPALLHRAASGPHAGPRGCAVPRSLPRTRVCCGACAGGAAHCWRMACWCGSLRCVRRAACCQRRQRRRLSVRCPCARSARRRWALRVASPASPHLWTTARRRRQAAAAAKVSLRMWSAGGVRRTCRVLTRRLVPGASATRALSAHGFVPEVRPLTPAVLPPARSAQPLWPPYVCVAPAGKRGSHARTADRTADPARALGARGRCLHLPQNRCARTRLPPAATCALTRLICSVQRDKLPRVEKGVGFQPREGC